MTSELIEKVVIGGDLSKLSVEDRLSYYNKLCESLSLNPLTRPFEYITLQGKLTLYARKDASEQLRKVNGISIIRLESKFDKGIVWVTVYAKDKTGREDIGTGAASITNKAGYALTGDELVNACLKAETKAKRRVTLSMGGLGFLDEDEVESIQTNKAIKEAESIMTASERITSSLIDIQTHYIDTFNTMTDLKELQYHFGNAWNELKKYKDYEETNQIKETITNKYDEIKLSLINQGTYDNKIMLLEKEGEEKNV